MAVQLKLSAFKNERHFSVCYQNIFINAKKLEQLIPLSVLRSGILQELVLARQIAFHAVSVVPSYLWLYIRF